MDFYKGTRFQPINIFHIRIQTFKNYALPLSKQSNKISISIGMNIRIKWKEGKYFKERYKMITSFNFAQVIKHKLL